jgi:hypothetical protein
LEYALGLNHVVHSTSPKQERRCQTRIINGTPRSGNIAIWDSGTLVAAAPYRD